MDTSPRSFFVAGVQHRPVHTIDFVCATIREARQKDSDPLLNLDVRLIGEPQNKYDRYAVKVEIEKQHIGYIPKPINVDIWALRDAGYKPHARLVEYNADAHPWLMFRIEVTFTKLP